MTPFHDIALDGRPPSDVCLMLRAHAQQQWLNRQVMPVLSDLKNRESVPEDQVAAAIAYLEVLWLEASLRAAETDAEFARLNATMDAPDGGLHGQVRRYHAAVRSLHKAVEARVAELVCAPADMRSANPAT